jgi:hypothetical protein
MDKLKSVLTFLLDAQRKCAPIKLSIGYVSKDNQVRNTRLVIYDAPPSIISELVKDKDIICSMSEDIGGFVITPLPEVQK